MAALSKPTNGSNADYANRVGALFDGVNTVNSWTPALTFGTPGDLSVTYSKQVGEYFELGRIGIVFFDVVTSAFTHTTAAGNLTISGLPISARATSMDGYINKCVWSGITKANYTEVAARVSTSGSTIIFIASGSGQARSLVTSANVPTGGTVTLSGMIIIAL